MTKAKKDSFVLAIDCGSTNFKTILLDQKGEVLARKSAPVEYEKSVTSLFDISPTIASRTIKVIIKAMIRSMKIQPYSITHIALTSQAQTFLIVNSKYEPLTPLISWIDARAVEEADFLNKKFADKLAHHSTFPNISPQMTAAKLLWAKKNYSALKESDNWRLMFLPEWIMFSLTGQHITDNNLAAMSGLYSLKKEDWNEDIMQEIGIARKHLPQVLKVGEKKEVELKEGFGRSWFPKKLFLIGAGNDQTAGAFGNAVREDELLITLGTALVIYRLQNKKGPYERKTAWGPFPYGKFYELAALTEGCLALDWAINKLSRGTSIQKFEELAKEFFEKNKKKLSDKLFFYPQRIESGAPWLNANHQINALAYSVFEGIAFAARKLIEENFKEKKLDKVCVTGGGSASDFWLSLIANSLKCKVRRGKGDAVFGAGIMAVRDNISEGNGKSKEDKVYLFNSEPEDIKIMEKRYTLWMKRE